MTFSGKVVDLNLDSGDWFVGRDDGSLSLRGMLELSGIEEDDEVVITIEKKTTNDEKRGTR